MTLEVAELDPVAVDDRQMADARPGQRWNDRRTDPTSTDDRDPRDLEPLLSDPADLRQDNVPRIAVELVVA